MKRRDRVSLALSGRGLPDRVPWMELGVEPGLCRLLSKRAGASAYDEHLGALDALGIDVATIDAGDLPRIARFRSETDYFVLAMTGGVFYDSATRMGFERFLAATKNRRDEVRRVLSEAARLNEKRSLAALDAGAHGVIVADDIAHARGPFVSPCDFRDLVLPFYEVLAGEIRGRGGFALFHSDGDVEMMLEDIISAGFQGIHSLQPSAGLDLASLKRAYGDRICLIGNVELEDAANLPSAADIEMAVAEAVSVGAPGGRFILSTSSGVLREAMGLARVLAYRDACRRLLHRYGSDRA